MTIDIWEAIGMDDYYEEFTFEAEELPDGREGYDVFIINDDGETCSLACAQNEEDPFDDGTRVPQSVVDYAEQLETELGNYWHAIH
jgi:hypothetical protein